MPSTEINLVDIDEELVEGLWSRIADSGGFYSIGDGVTREHFRRMLFSSSLAMMSDSVFLRFEAKEDFNEMHPLVFSHKAFNDPEASLQRAYSLGLGVFRNLPLCCIIPNRMKGLKRLAEKAGMDQSGYLERSLTGIPVSCSKYLWRPQDV
jgi:hypothetical protein